MGSASHRLAWQLSSFRHSASNRRCIVGSHRHREKLPRDEVLFEAAAVLAGTMLMASGVSGSGPNTFGSNVTLGSLMEPIALNRDRFYEALLSRLTGPHADRLQRKRRFAVKPSVDVGNI